MKFLLKFWPAFVILGLVVIFFRTKIFPANGNFIGGADVAMYFFWHERFIKEQLLSANLPLWNPYYYCGHPFLANPQTFVFYPATFLFVVLPLPWAFNIDTLLHIFLAGLGMYFFVSLVTESKTASLASAVIYCLSGYFMDQIPAGHLTMIHTAAIMPWIFYFVEKGIKTGSNRFFAFAGIVFGLQILSGEPQNNYYTGLFLVIYFAIRHFSAPGPSRLKLSYRPVLFAVMVFLIGAGISAIQILPSLEFMSLSDRAEKTYQFAVYFSFPPRNFYTFLVPLSDNTTLRIYWELSGYIGITALILAGIGVVCSRQCRQQIWCFRIMAIFAVTIMLGNHTPLYHLYYKFLPGIATFRIPSRCMVIFVYCLAVFAGLGLQRMCESTFTKKFCLAAMLWWAVLVACLFTGAVFFKVPLVSGEMAKAVVLFIAAFFVLTLNYFRKNKNLIAILTIAVLFADLLVIYSTRNPYENEKECLTKGIDDFPFSEQNTGLYRVASPIDDTHGMDFRYYGVNGYTPIALNSYYRFMHEMANVPIRETNRHTLNPLIFRLDVVFSSKILNIKYAIIQIKDGFVGITADKVMPRAVLVKNAVILPRFDDQLQYIKQPDFDPLHLVLLEKPPDKNLFPRTNTTPAPPDGNNVIITKYQPNRIKLDCSSADDTYLVLSELFYPGWHAYIDGTKVDILRADYLLRAIPLPSGRHNVVFIYRPVSLLAGAAITILTLLVLAVLLLRSRLSIVENKAAC